MTDSSAKTPSYLEKREKGSYSRRRFVIINGDDFGFSSGVNQGIITAHKEGVLTSTSLMVTAPAFDEAVALAHEHPKLAVGLHLVLGSGKSVLPPSQIPHLVDSNGNFSDKHNEAGIHYHLSKGARQELPLEIRAQLEKFRSTGLQLSHVDGHNHMHFNPIVLHTLVSLAEEFNIKVIRLPYEELGFTLNVDSGDRVMKIIWYLVMSGLRRYGEPLLKAKGIISPKRVYGWLESGRMSEDYLLGLIPQIQEDFVEIYCHPAIAIPGEPRNGPQGAGQLELNALTSPRIREMLASKGFELINYNNRDAIALQQ
ncbi:hopanoid biosynthesis-associated protein HpnK [Aetokthonos hydrillicola Thurmond2011]|jgi:hopanoid biosynthesis associated protein HpnK|uniref:Hopanoid biosynthesis-associated protein HpnK n=1 Tax=Aetokthonos hydrillicola Thurmond2011 TaxID=2712845 RepID=A0AAP5I6Q4_9CYAN|nr:hopanoid biosynthesis-associated protein HpnK [Aetokthonos hydrillicola]MBO3461873.1 hopanoid biosynthesis-associated protein HpnK [Aetokthonos hydrillicola CCALA 1050]MBW4586785.1 hopanoid biosynthesis-associated protein HpnK [Aetokthonos hydrillicola CCALA 1050]MDR9895856.1 hopanoid biosynthesis-associated protein HpnK [Aetokthonos hydrillicola Thurmond2011]